MSRVELDSSRTDLVFVRSKIPYRRRMGDLVQADSARLKLDRGLAPFGGIDGVRQPSPLGPPADPVPLMNALMALEKMMAAGR